MRLLVLFRRLDPDRGSVVANFGWLAFGNGSARLLMFLATCILARRLGQDNMGILGFAQTVLGYLMVATTWGLNVLGTRDMAGVRDRQELGAYAGKLVATRLVLVAVAGVIFVACVPLMASEPLVRHVLLVYALTVVPFTFNIGWAYCALEKMGCIGVSMAASRALFLAGVWLLVRGEANTVLVPYLWLAAITCESLIMMGLLRRFAAFRLAMDGTFFKSALRDGKWIALSKVLISFHNSFPVTYFGLTSSYAEAGVFWAAYRFYDMANTGVSYMLNAIFPVAARIRKEDPRRFRRFYIKACAAICGGALALGAGIFLAAPWIIQLAFGLGFQGGVPVLRVLSFVLPVLALRLLLTDLLVIGNRLKTNVAAQGAGLLANTACCFLLIPRWGGTGGAIALGVGELASVMTTALLLRCNRAATAPAG